VVSLNSRTWIAEHLKVEDAVTRTITNSGFLV
jgi:hypothetical protein